MDEETRYGLALKYSKSYYIMDRYFMWILLQFKLLNEDIEEYNSVKIEGNYNEIKVKSMLKEVEGLNITGRITSMIWELEKEIRMVETRVLSDEEKFKVKNKEEEIEYREEIIEELKTLQKKYESRGLSEVEKL